MDAVSLDVGPYIQAFWPGVFGDDYFHAHEEALPAQTNLKIRRVFILDPSILRDPNSNDKRKLVETVLTKHKSLGPRLQAHVVFNNSLPPSWSGRATSFLISDDCFASESYSLSDGDTKAGYVAHTLDRDVVPVLKELFEDFMVPLSRPELAQVIAMPP